MKSCDPLGNMISPACLLYNLRHKLSWHIKISSALADIACQLRCTAAGANGAELDSCNQQALLQTSADSPGSVKLLMVGLTGAAVLEAPAWLFHRRAASAAVAIDEAIERLLLPSVGCLALLVRECSTRLLVICAGLTVAVVLALALAELIDEPGAAMTLLFPAVYCGLPWKLEMRAFTMPLAVFLLLLACTTPRNAWLVDLLAVASC